MLVSAQKLPQTVLGTFFFFFILVEGQEGIKDSEREYIKVDENLLGLGACVDSRHLHSTV